MAKIDPLACIVSVLVLLALVELGCTTKPNQAGPSSGLNDPESQSLARLLPGAAEWLRLYLVIFSRTIGPAHLLSEDIVVADSKRMATLEASQDFRAAREWLESDGSIVTMRNIAKSPKSLKEYELFHRALKERSRLEKARQFSRLTRDGLGVMEQLINLSHQNKRNCQIESLKHMSDLLKLYQYWPNLHRYIALRLDSQRKNCWALFATAVSKGVNRLQQLGGHSLELLEKVHLRIDQHNQPPPPFAFVPEFSQDALYHALASEIKLQTHRDQLVSDIETRQLDMIHKQLKRPCRLISPNNLVKYYNQFMYLYGFISPTLYVVEHMVPTMRHLIKFEICNKIVLGNFSVSRVLALVDQMEKDEARISVQPGDAIDAHSQQQSQGQEAHQAANHGLDKPASGQLGTKQLAALGSGEEEDFCEALARAVAENYARDSGIGPSSLPTIDLDQLELMQFDGSNQKFPDNMVAEDMTSVPARCNRQPTQQLHSQSEGGEDWLDQMIADLLDNNEIEFTNAPVGYPEEANRGMQPGPSTRAAQHEPSEQPSSSE